jgi:DNA modification methylase
MCGSGTVLKHAVELGHRAIGLDLDPLAVLLSRAACSSVTADDLSKASERVIATARRTNDVRLPWIDDDEETLSFVDYWFDKPQQLQLRQLATVLASKRGPIPDLLRVALSRTIITKDRGASLARDVSHSRPHRVRDENDYDVFEGFASAARRIGKVVDRPTTGTAQVRRGDSRRMRSSLSGTVDLVITSPPYLNAIDYMRGHRLSLIWLGHSIPNLRRVRSRSIGTERGPDRQNAMARELTPRHKGLSDRQQGMLDRYAVDVASFMAQVKDTLKPGGEAVVVVGDSSLSGVFVANSSIVRKAASRAGLAEIDRRSRPLPAASRYLPPPSDGDGPMSKRMRSEVVFRFCRPSDN